MSEGKGVDAVDRALAILGCFGPGRTVLTLSEIAATTGFYKSTILRLAVSLQAAGYVVRAEDGRFRLGPSAWRIGAAYRSSFTLSDVMRPEVKRLADLTNETASYYVREGHSRICLFRSEPVRSIRHSIIEGDRMPLDKGASGKVLSAFADDGFPQAEEIRACGYAVSLGERDPEVAAVAVPVMGAHNQLLGALSLSGLITRFTKEPIAEFVVALREAQSRLETKLTE